MPKFELQYAYQCPRCRKLNISTLVVAAADESVARETAVASTICDRCRRHLKPDQQMTVRVKEL